MEFINLLKLADVELGSRNYQISTWRELYEASEKKVTELQAKYDGLQAQLTAKVPAEKDGWKPLRGEEYWFFDSDGETDREINGKTIGDLALIRLGNCAPTEEELRAKEPEILRALGLEKWEG